LSAGITQVPLQCSLNSLLKNATKDYFLCGQGHCGQYEDISPDYMGDELMPVNPSNNIPRFSYVEELEKQNSVKQQKRNRVIV